MGKDKKKDKKGDATSRLLERLEHDGIERVKVGGFDVDGVLRGKYVSLDKFRSALAGGFGFCDVIFGWDVADALYDNATVTGWDTGYPDTLALLDPNTLRTIPWEPGVAAMLCDFHVSPQQSHPACPRSLLKRVITRANKLGYEPMVGVEFEFFLFKENRDSVDDKQYVGLSPMDRGMFGYSWVRTGQDAELMREIWNACRDFGIALEGLHTETGPGVYEAAIQYTGALEAADQAALFKTALKQIVHRNGYAVTFMAKCDPKLPGASGHLHQSLRTEGRNVFFDGRRRHGMSDVMRSYIAGQLKVMRDWTCLYSPTVNSYKRYVPGLWAPLVPSWGVENRTCALRVVAPGSEKALRVEYRQTAADINPYIAIAASLGAGLYGIEKGLQLEDETIGEAVADGRESLPTSLREAANLLDKSRTARQVLGKGFVEHYVITRQWEAREFDKAVTDWERRRYFETV